MATSRSRTTGGPVPPYGEAIQQAVASGDLARMKAVASEAETFIAQWGNIPAALEALRLEIAKMERGASGAAPAGGAGARSASRSRSSSSRSKKS